MTAGRYVVVTYGRRLRGWGLFDFVCPDCAYGCLGFHSYADATTRAASHFREHQTLRVAGR